MSFTTERHPGVADTPASETRGFVFNHSMLRVKDPDGYWIEIVQPDRLATLGSAGS